MKHRALNTIAVLAVAGLCAASTMFAQNGILKADIPFDFVVADRTLPAGTYEVQCNPNQSPLVKLQGVDVEAGLFAMTSPTQSTALNREGKLIFNRYGNSYFLSQVWRAGSNQGGALSASKAEREIAARVAKGGKAEVAMHR